MKSPFIIESGRGRVILNAMDSRGSLMVDVNGAGYTLLLEPGKMLALAAELKLLAVAMMERAR